MAISPSRRMPLPVQGTSGYGWFHIIVFVIADVSIIWNAAPDCQAFQRGREPARRVRSGTRGKKKWREKKENIFAEEDEDLVTYLDEHPEAAGYVSAWVAEDGDWRIEVFDEDGGLKLMVVHKLGDNKEDIWEYAAAMGEGNKLTAVPLGLHYKQDTVTDNWDVTYYEDGDAEFEITEDGKLVWKDMKEDAGNGLAFEKIGSFYGDRRMKGDIEVIFYDWYDGQYDIRLYQRGENGEILKDAILKGDYDAATDTLTATGEFEGEEPITVVFSYDEHNQMVWNENGESTVLEFSFLTD